MKDRHLRLCYSYIYFNTASVFLFYIWTSLKHRFDLNLRQTLAKWLPSYLLISWPVEKENFWNDVFCHAWLRMQRQKVYFDGSLLIRMKIKSSQCHNQKNPYTHTTKKESVLWQDKLKSLIQDPAHRGEHVTETWAALLETKESRIAIMERDISLLEKELLQQQQLMQQQRDHWVRSIEQSNPSTPVPRTATPSQQAAVAAAQLYRNSPVNNGQTAQHKDAVSLLLFFYCLPFFVWFF